MKTTRNLQIKIKRLLKQIKFPEYLHHFGPKKFKLENHISSLLLMQICKASLRRTEFIANLFGQKCPTYSALCKSRKRIPLDLWQKLLKLTAGFSSGKVGIDGTGLTKTNPSFHYLKRIDCKNPKNYTKLSALFDLEKKKFLMMRIRTSPRHDMQDVKYLLSRIEHVNELYGDTGYCAEWLHELCYWRKVQTFIKPKKNTKMKGFRKIQMKNYDERKYHKRSLIETGFSCIKRKYGGTTNAKKIQGMRVEAFCKGIAHNLNLENRKIFNSAQNTTNLK